MKYLITESKLDNVIFKYLDNQDFIRVNKNKEICFLNSSDDLWAVMKYMRDKLIISDGLTKEISSFFSLDEDDTEIVIRDWVSSKINIDIPIWQVHTMSGMIADVNLSM
jgi:lipopolysaccharide export LptBFGC system permease protein LptF